jgi:DNA replication and repair protein RecF
VSLLVECIALKSFRSYADRRIELGEEITILVGANAQGKTNAIEALQLLTEGDSFRHPVWTDLVAWGSTECLIEARFTGDGRDLVVEMKVGPSGRRVYSVNGKKKRSAGDVAGLVPCVLFTPDDLLLVKGSADKRRASIDSLGSQLSRTYADIRKEYDRVVRQRNALLKHGAAQGVLDPWTDRLIEIGTRLTIHRAGLFERLAPRLSSVYGQLSGDEELAAVYSCSLGDDVSEKAFLEAIEARADEERARGTTVVGPHRDDIVFLVNGQDARRFASQGQQRSIALAWKMAEVTTVSDVSGSRPILLLDDVMSELDESRRHALTEFVGRAAQTVVTTTNIGYFEPELLSRARVEQIP